MEEIGVQMACLHCGTLRPVAHRLSSEHGPSSSCALPGTLSSMCASDYIHYQSGVLKEEGNGSKLLSETNPYPSENPISLWDL